MIKNLARTFLTVIPYFPFSNFSVRFPVCTSTVNQYDMKNSLNVFSKFRMLCQAKLNKILYSRTLKRLS